jgi:transcriptional regulator with PAS, ATPase and Fis domain
MRSDFQSSQEQYGILGESVEMKEIVEVIDQVGPTDITVLITGESGVGKEVIAKAIYTASQRNKKPFMTVNSGAIPEGILESELFGHEKGSFTGASEQRKGYFELADGGTIFLDEIGELPLSAQVKFLRILENGEFLRVGSSVPRKVNVRVIAATNKDLESEVRHNQFRADLFYRLRSVNIHIPPLRKRPEDVEVFFKYFVEEFAAKNNTRYGGISDEAMQLLKSYHWPGNVRELRNVVESMLVIEGGKRLESADVKKYLKEYREVTEERNLPVHLGRSVEQAERELILRALLDIKGNILDLGNQFAEQANRHNNSRHDSIILRDPREETNLSLQEMEKRLIAEALQRFKNNRRVAARALNISERTLYRKIKEYGLG